MNRGIASSLFFFLMMFSCDDVLEKDISKKEVFLKTPAPDYSTDQPDQLFWWDHLEGATAYEVLIVTPDMDNPTALLLDSVVTENKLRFTLSAGEFQWCVRGTNNGYKTAYTCRTLFIVN